ncbi:MAG TPA: hypothetical protein VEI97_14815, partial [bacterium]|nr:hypothetical protein [bacterium]
MVVRLCLLGWLVCWPLRLVGAPGPGRNQAVAVLNQYVGYCNETIHALWMLHEAWRGLNTSA